MIFFSDEYYMRIALSEAEKAYHYGEIPVGVIVVSGEKILAKTYNLTEALQDVTAHAEMQAITAATQNLDGKYLPHATLYVTLEPCVMCAGALTWAQIGRVVWGADDLTRGFRAKGLSLHPKTEIMRGVLAEECSTLLLRFFQNLR